MNSAEYIISFIEYLHQHIPLEDDEKQFLRELLTIENHQKGEHLLKADQISQAFYYILEGSIRLYYIKEGQEKTAFFYTENEFASSYKSYVRQIPADHYLQCSENSKLIKISRDAADQLLLASPKFSQIAMLIMENEMGIYQSIISSFICLTAEERYAELLKNKPNLLQRFPQHQLATYLGVSPETLSRIRKRISQKWFIDERQCTVFAFIESLSKTKKPWTNT